MKTTNTNKRMKAVYIAFGLVMVLELAGLFVNSGTVKGISDRADKLRAYAEAERDDASILAGDILDRNGNVIAETDNITVIEGEDDEATTKRVTSYSDGKAFSQLVGYTGDRNLSPLAESEDNVVGGRNDSRLMAFLDEDYWNENGLYSITDIDGTKGQSAMLTIDSDLQLKVSEILKQEMSDSSDIGSAVVMNAKTGEILADVSYPTYDFNDLDSALKQMQKDEEETNLEPGYPITYKRTEAPGSIFKVLMSVALIDHGMEDYQVTNDSYTMDSGWTCDAVSYNSSTLSVGAGDNMNMETALNISSNVYFSKAALTLGSDKLNETASKFMLREDGSYVSLDFGNVQYNWDLNVSNTELAQTGFGQGKTGFSTITAAMITDAIANKGSIMKPYMVKQLMDADGNTVYEGKATELSEATSEETAAKVASMMRSTASECCRYHNLPEAGTIFEKYQVAGKTGTSENGDEDATNNAWYISFAPADDPEYVVVVNQCRTHKAGYTMVPLVADIYEYLFER